MDELLQLLISFFLIGRQRALARRLPYDGLLGAGYQANDGCSKPWLSRVIPSLVFLDTYMRDFAPVTDYLINHLSTQRTSQVNQRHLGRAPTAVRNQP